MSATLLSFTRRSPGWDNEELAMLIRVQRLLTGAGIGVEIDYGMTEEGDPWCVFCTAGSGDVVIHVARIDGVYVLDSASLASPIEGRSLMNCAERFISEASLVAPAANRTSTLYMHPSAVLAGVFMTIMLFAQIHNETGSFGEVGHIDDLEGELEDAADTLPWLKQIANQVAAFLMAERQGERLTPDQALPSQNWVILQSAAMIATFALAQDEKLLAALLSGGFIDTALVLPEETAETAAAEATETTAEPADTESTDEMDTALFAPGDEIAPSQMVDEILASAGEIAIGAAFLTDADGEDVLGLGPDDPLATGDTQLQGTTGEDVFAFVEADTVAAPDEAHEEDLETSEDEDANSGSSYASDDTADQNIETLVLEALFAAGAEEVDMVPETVQIVIEDVWSADRIDLDPSLAEPLVPEQPQAPVVPADVGGERVRQTVLDAKDSVDPLLGARHLRIDDVLFDDIRDDVARYGQQRLIDGDVVYFDDLSSQHADPEDLLLLSVENADESLSILVTYAASPGLEDWLSYL